jgi:dihydroorotase
VALLLKHVRAVDPSAGLDQECDIVIRDGRIVEIGQDLAIPKGETVECAEKVLLPGLVDAHTHLRQPGREDEETVASGTRAAAHGGFTAVCAMPNTEPVADQGAAVRALLEIAASEGAVRVHPLGAITAGQRGESLAEIGDMVASGAIAFSDDGHGVPEAGLMRLAMDYVKRFDVPIVSHCEDATLSGRGVVNEGVVSTRLGLPGWPAAAEEIQIARDIRLAELTGCRLHVAHVSTARGVDLVRQGKARGVRVTCEVTPHHLFLTEDDLTESYDTDLKMNPPLRTAEDAAALVDGLLDATVDCIATDHAPHAPHEKALEFELAPFGTIGLETALPLVCTHLVASGRADWADVARWMCHGPREALGLPAVRIELGCVADLTIVDPEAKVDVAPDYFCSKSRNSAFLGARLLGRATEVLVGGYFALRNGKVVV